VEFLAFQPSVGDHRLQKADGAAADRARRLGLDLDDLGFEASSRKCLTEHLGDSVKIVKSPQLGKTKESGDQIDLGHRDQAT